MKKSTKENMDLVKDTKVFFGSSYYVVNYDLDPVNPRSLNRLIEIEEIPGRFAKFFGVKSINRKFIGRVAWYEVIGDKKVQCPASIVLQLTDICSKLEQKNRKLLKARQLKS